MKSHLISQVVLKRFANSDKKVMVHTVATKQKELRKTEEIAYRNVDQTLIGQLEQQWSKDIEDPAEKALNALSAGNLLYFEKHVIIVKKLLALHFLRANIFTLMTKAEWTDQFYPKEISEVIKAYPHLQSEITEMWERTKMQAAIEAVTVNSAKADALLEKYGFEVGEAPDGCEFILGDLPAITTDGTGRVGPQNGVALTDARGFAMPLTPKFLVALKKDPSSKKYIKLTPRQVENVNSKTIQQLDVAYFSTASYNQ